VGEWLKPPVC